MAYYLHLNSQPPKEDKKAEDDDKEDDDDDFDLFGSDEEEEDEEVCEKINKTFHAYNSMHRLLMSVSILHEHCTLLHPLSILGYLILAILVSFARKKRRGKQDLHNMRPRMPKVSICTSLCLCTLLSTSSLHFFTA